MAQQSEGLIPQDETELTFRPRFVPNPDRTALAGVTSEQVAGIGRSQVKMLRKARMASVDLWRG